MTPKAGPKKRRAKTEQEQIRVAVEENKRRGSLSAGRKSSKVRRYSYKDKETDTAKRKRADRYISELERVFGLRLPKYENEFLAFLDDLKEDEQPFAVKLFQMTCEHPAVEVVANGSSYVNADTAARYLACIRCGLVRQERSKTAMLKIEWESYCPDGYDMFDWWDLLTKDKSLWRFIHDEVLAEQADEAMIGEEG